MHLIFTDDRGEHPHSDNVSSNGGSPRKTHEPNLERHPSDPNDAAAVKVTDGEVDSLAGAVPVSDSPGSAPFSVSARARWVVGAMKAANEVKEDTPVPLNMAQVVEAHVKLNRWRRMKRRLTERFDQVKSRGMPPIFGFFGKVSAKGKKALANSIILLIANLIFIGSCAYGFVAIENNEDFTAKRLKPLQEAREGLIYYLGPELNLTEDGWVQHHPSHVAWLDKQWDKLMAQHSSRCFKLDNQHTQANLWNYWSSFDFCATVLTTIGYGSMSPKSHLGKWFCLLYSIFGIPIMAMYLALFSKGILAIVESVITLISNVLTTINRNFSLSDMLTRVLSLLFLLGGLFVFVCMWSAILNKSNPADGFVKCVYFYVITLTTVGLGDISMTEAQPFVLIRVLFLFCVGLTLVTAVFNALRSVSAAHTRMIKDKGRRLTNKAQEVVMDKTSTFRARHTNGDGQLDPLTGHEEDNNLGEQYAEGHVETTFTTGNADDPEQGFNSKGYRQFDNNS